MTALILAAGYALSGFLVEVSHHDVHDLFLYPEPAVTSHECGAREVHIPLDQGLQCFACTHSSHRVADVLTPLAGPHLAVIVGVPFPDVAPLVSNPDLNRTGTRGPPRNLTL